MLLVNAHRANLPRKELVVRAAAAAYRRWPALEDAAVVEEAAALEVEVDEVARAAELRV